MSDEIIYDFCCPKCNSNKIEAFTNDFFCEICNFYFKDAKMILVNDIRFNKESAGLNIKSLNPLNIMKQHLQIVTDSKGNEFEIIMSIETDKFEKIECIRIK